MVGICSSSLGQLSQPEWLPPFLSLSFPSHSLAGKDFACIRLAGGGRRQFQRQQESVICFTYSSYMVTTVQLVTVVRKAILGWFCLVWFGMVWYGSVWFGLVYSPRCLACVNCFHCCRRGSILLLVWKYIRVFKFKFKFFNGQAGKFRETFEEM